MKLVHWLVAISALAISNPAAAQAPATPAKTTATLILANDSIRPGEILWAAIQLRLRPGWHTYWRNSGDSGAPTTIDWTLPSGLTAGHIMWPVPEKLTAAGFTTYVYHDEVLLLVPLSIASHAPMGENEIHASIRWLECDKLCVPGFAKMSARVTIGNATNPSPEAPLIESWQKKTPRPEPGLHAHAQWEAETGPNNRAVLIEWKPKNTDARVDFFPYEADGFEIETPSDVVANTANLVRLRKTVRNFGGSWPAAIAGLIIEQPGPDTVWAREVKLDVAPAVSIQ